MNNKKKFVLELTKIYGNVCQYCGKGYNTTNPITIEHIIPQTNSRSFKFFVNSLENVIPVCRLCNQKKSSLHYRTFLFTEYGAEKCDFKISKIDECRIMNNLTPLKDLELIAKNNYMKVQEGNKNNLLNFPEDLKEKLKSFFLLDYNYDNFLILEPQLQLLVQTICRYYKNLSSSSKFTFYKNFILNDEELTLVVGKNSETFTQLGKKEMGKIIEDMQFKNKVKCSDIDVKYPKFVEYLLTMKKGSTTDEFNEDFFIKLQKIYIYNLHYKFDECIQNKIKQYLFDKENRFNFEEINNINFLNKEKLSVILAYIKSFIPIQNHIIDQDNLKQCEETVLSNPVLEVDNLDIVQEEPIIDKLVSTHHSLEKMNEVYVKIKGFLDDGWEIEDLEVSFRRHKTKIEKY